MNRLNFAQLCKTVATDAAIRRVQRLQPAGGPGDKVFPSTYPGEGKNATSRHAFEERQVGGKKVRCVMLDSVQSQANRLEEALLKLMREGRIKVPNIIVNFADMTGLSDLGEISSLDAPHRVFDAIIRDSELDGQKFTETDHYKALLLAKPSNALPVFRLSPTSLVFGVWNSTGEGGGVGAKFSRCIVSEIVGIDAVDGQKGAVRIDPLGIRASAKVLGGPLNWTVAGGEKGEKSIKPSEINHSNIISNLVPGGVTIDYALHTAVITCAGLRRLRFPERQDENAGRSLLAALALVALAGQDQAGYALRSRCDLVCDSRAPFEIVHPDGTTDPFEVDLNDAIKLFEEAVEAARKAGLPWEEEPIQLVPQQRLVDLVRQSRDKALAGESETEDRNNG